MPVVQANGIDVHYEVQGEGEPVVVIPYLAADQACYAFQVADYAKNFTCFTVDLRGAGLSGKPPFSTRRNSLPYMRLESLARRRPGCGRGVSAWPPRRPGRS